MEQFEIDHYRECMQKYPDVNDARHYGWTAQSNQEIRFDKISQVMNVRELQRASYEADKLKITDFGCGDGSLFLHLATRGLGSNGEYFGFDAMQENIDTARQLANSGTLPNARFARATWDGTSPLPSPTYRSGWQPDYTVESGAFAFTHRLWIPPMVKRLAEQARIGFIGNFLMPSALVGKAPEGTTLTRPEKLLKWFNHDTYAVVLLTDYMPIDFTLGIFHRDVLMEDLENMHSA